MNVGGYFISQRIPVKESDLTRAIQIALAQEGARVFRNETGSYQSPTGQWVSYGLIRGSSDLIGWSDDGRFVACEVKIPGGITKKKRLEEQKNFIQQVNRSGGIGFFAHSVEEAVRKYRERKA